MTCRYCNHLDEWENDNSTPMTICKLDYHQVRTDIETCDNDTTDDSKDSNNKEVRF